ncbi:MAG: hypothetical protein A4E53_03465 [Pelotomaculum sp. PtaB.Bin104]|nr:MAG: hypothetical protein A4E53_03465 [Pelotomaculum sp. PtaB.Bin104]
MIKSVNIPNPLAKSFKGKYFVGYADNLTFGKGTSAWAGLFNPVDSGIYLFVNVWTITELLGTPIRAQIWFNSTPPGAPVPSPLVTPANTAISPPPRPKVHLLEASNVTGSPCGGIKAFVRRATPETTLVFEEDGKYIFAPGGNLTVFLSNPESPEENAAGRVAFGWWEEKNYTL